MGKSTFVLMSLLILSNILWSQEHKLDNTDSVKVKNQLLAYPLAFYLPETRWGFGGAGFYNFRFKGEQASSFPSQLQFAATYTLNKQIIFLLPFELYKSNNLYKVKGELTYFKYQFNYYGIGNNTNFSDREPFKVNSPRVRLDMLKRYNKTFYGIRTAFDNFDIVDVADRGLLEADAPIGIDGGRMVGIGVLMQNDHRDFLFNSTKGHYLEIEYFVSNNVIGSNFNYQRLLLNATKYVKLKDEHTLVMNLNTVNITGKVPFYDMAFFGSPKLMRGFQDRRFLDKNMILFQSEYRYPIYKWLAGVVFASTGTVAPRYSKLFSSPYKLAYGAGLRFTLNKKDRVRMRLDYGRAPEEGGAFYLTVNEAF
ncbi:MAG TPA: BamA/TamA family outer membrane protein [Saprospiraceae bacterium]|nr:BamA/TamA family outer membrane protein [Saprospiraceae bacterium]